MVTGGGGDKIWRLVLAHLSSSAGLWASHLLSFASAFLTVKNGNNFLPFLPYEDSARTLSGFGYMKMFGSNRVLEGKMCYGSSVS